MQSYRQESWLNTRIRDYCARHGRSVAMRPEQSGVLLRAWGLCELAVAGRMASCGDSPLDARTMHKIIILCTAEARLSQINGLAQVCWVGLNIVNCTVVLRGVALSL